MIAAKRFAEMAQRKFHWRMLYRPMPIEAAVWCWGVLLGAIVTWLLIEFIF